MFQTTQSPGTDRIQQVGTFSPIATTSETLRCVAFVWFTDEKIFTVAAPSNSQNDRVHAARDTLKKQIAVKRLLRTRNTFSQSIMVSVGVSQLGCTELFFVDPGTKINGAN